MAITTSLKLWCNAKIIPSRNLKIEFLENYLNANTNEAYNKTFTNIMFFKEIQSLEFDKVIDADQLNLQSKYDYSWDYATISIVDTATTESIFKGYYFITKKTWTSTSSLKLHFVLDTINTYEILTTIPTTSVKNKYSITARSKVLREHKDRFSKNTSHKSTFVHNSQVVSFNYFFNQTSRIWAGFTLLKEVMPEFTGNVNELRFVMYCNLRKNGQIIQANVQLISSSVEITGETDTTFNFSVYFPLITDYQGFDWTSTSVNFMNVEITTYVTNLSRKIDLQSEGVLPILYKEELGELTQPFNTGWYLYYKTEHELSQESSNAVECLLIPEKTIKTKLDASIGIKTGASFPNFQNIANLYFVWNEDANNLRGAPRTDNDIVKIKIGNDVIQTAWRTLQFTDYNNMTVEQDVIRLQVSPDDASQLNIYFYKYHYVYRNGELYASDRQDVNSWLNVVDIKFLNIVSGGTTITAFITADVVCSPSNLLNAVPSYSISFASITEATIYSLENYDRTISTLIKIIKLPYCPTDYTYDYENETFSLPPYFEYSNGELKLSDINVKFTANIETSIANPVLNAMFMEHVVSTLQSRDKSLESKMFHSDYYQIKFVYDSFSYTIPLEKIDVVNTNFTDFFRFKFVMTSTMNSKFAFMFEDIVYKYATEDYPNVLCVARNNEEVIYNSTYLNYLRTAYNYDLKAKERTEMASTIGTALTIVGSVASVGLAVASQNPALIVSSIIGATASITSSVINNVNTIAQQEANQESKLKQLQAQSVSVAGSDDVDIMSAYSNNRAKLCLYKVSERMYNALNDLFYYTGYATNEMKIPNMHTRYYFDFVAMNPEVINICNLSDEIIEDIKTRWANGVTIMHGEDNQWNMAQDKENWEVNLL